MTAVATTHAGATATNRIGALASVTCFALAALLVAVLSLPWGKLPADFGGLLATAGLTLVVTFFLLGVSLAGALVARVLAGHPRVLAGLAAVALLSALFGVEWVCGWLGDKDLKLDFGELYDDFHAPVELSLAVLGLGALLVLSPERFRVGISRAGAVAVAVALAGSALVVASYGSQLPRMSRALIDSDHLTSFAHKTIVWMFDADSDGSPRFGGIDCDDHDPNVNPMRSEVPGNGKDDNCMLGDGVVAAPPPLPRTPLATPVKRVVLLVWDAVRADHLSLYGYGRQTAPKLTALADDATAFFHVSSTAGMTRSFYAGLTSGSYQVPPPSPPRSLFGRVDPAAFERIEVPDVSFFKALGDAGINREGCFLHREAFKAFSPAYTHAICPGCEAEARRNSRITSPVLLKCAKTLVPQIDKDKPTLIVMHLFDPHGKYRKHKGRPRKWGWDQMAFYDGEILFTDKYMKRILDVFEANGLLQDAAIIVTSDHGEGFSEHGRTHHGYTAYDEMNRVPLLIKMPGQKGQRWVKQPVENGDLAPTILDLFGVQTEVPVTGASLVPYLADVNAPAVRPMTIGYAVRTPDSSFAITHWPWKAIWDRRLNLWELHNLDDDPAEANDLARSRPEILEPLKKELELRIERHHL